MFSPYQLISSDKNYLEIESNLDLANKLATFFSRPETDFLWRINTGRQRMASELKHTRMIALRKPVAKGNLQYTMEWNQITQIEDDMLLHNVALFNSMYQWLDSIMRNTGASKVEWGRLFFSKHLAGTSIGLHADEGAYFDYFDRFHFVINSNSDNVFYIRNQPIVLDTGKVYWVNNHVPHWLENHSTTDRINVIFDVRLS
jgi:hypothetical protein